MGILVCWPGGGIQPGGGMGMVPFGKRGGTGGMERGKGGMRKGKGGAVGWEHPGLMAGGAMGVTSWVVLLREEKDGG